MKIFRRILAGTSATLILAATAIPDLAVAQAPGAPYYDRERDVIVTPADTRSNGTGESGLAVSDSTSAQPYYDPILDVIVTPIEALTPSAAATPPRSTSISGSSYPIVLRDGQLVDGPATITAALGEPVTLVLDSDRADTLRVDGYGLSVPLIAGQQVLFTFVAERPGSFAYRLAGSGREVGSLQVRAAQLSQAP